MARPLATSSGYEGFVPSPALGPGHKTSARGLLALDEELPVTDLELLIIAATPGSPSGMTTSWQVVQPVVEPARSILAEAARAAPPGAFVFDDPGAVLRGAGADVGGPVHPESGQGVVVKLPGRSLILVVSQLLAGQLRRGSRDVDPGTISCLVALYGGGVSRLPAALGRPGFDTLAVSQRVCLSDPVYAAPAAWTSVHPDATSVPPPGAQSPDIAAMLVSGSDVNQIMQPQIRLERQPTRVDTYGEGLADGSDEEGCIGEGGRVWTTLDKAIQRMECHRFIVKHRPRELIQKYKQMLMDDMGVREAAELEIAAEWARAREDLVAKARGLKARPLVPGETSDHDVEDGDVADKRDLKGKGGGRSRRRSDKKDTDI